MQKINRIGDLTSLVVPLGILLAFFIMTTQAQAATTTSLLPTSDGAYASWTPKSGSTHYTMVDEASCNGTTDYVSTATAGNRDSYGISLSSIPDGSTITNIQITPCASRNSNGGGSSNMSVFYRYGGVNSADSATYALTGTTPANLSATNFGSLSLSKSASSSLQIGAVYSSGTKGARLGRVATVITYDAPTAPNAPSAVVTFVGTSSVSLTWTDNSTNETGFKVERKANAGSYSEIGTVSSNVTSYFDNTVVADNTYTYRVRAYNGVGNSTYATGSAAVFGLPTAPSGTGTFASSSSLVVVWTDNSVTETGFKVERSDNGGSYSEIGTVSANMTVYSDTTVVADNIYTYRVRAVNVNGHSAYATGSSSVFGLPTAPSAATATLFSSTTAQVSWTDNSITETGFKIERSTNGGSFSQIDTVGSNVTSYNNFPVFSGNTYTYRVRATNSNGDSTYSTSNDLIL